MSDYTRWYRAGQVAVTVGSKNVTGTNTYWLSAGLHPGDFFSVDDGASFYEIDTIADNTHITLKTPFNGTSDANSAYCIARNFTATTGAEIAAQTSALLSDFRQYVDNDMQRITGKSAYESAKSLGYTGTESQWLESLKAAGEWAKVNKLTNFLNEPVAVGIHNSFFRGKNLGSKVTDAQYAAIANETFDDIFIGDYWEIEGVKHRVAHLNYYKNRYGTSSSYPDWIPAEDRVRTGLVPPHIMIVPDNTIISGPWHTDDTLQQAYIGTNFWNEVLPALHEKLKGWFGNNHLLPFRLSVPNAVNDAHTSISYGKRTTKASLLGSMELFGVPSNSTMQANIYRDYDWAGQMQLFRLNPKYINGDCGEFILRDYYGWVNGQAKPNSMWFYGMTVASGQRPDYRVNCSYRPFYGLTTH